MAGNARQRPTRLAASGYRSGTTLVCEPDREMPSKDLAVTQEASPFKRHKLLFDCHYFF